MAMRRIAAAAVLRTRRSEVASVMATGGRRYLAALSAEERKEKEIERRVQASMELHFDVRVRDIVRSEMREILRDAAADANSGLDIQRVMENDLRKHWLSLQEGLANQKLYFEEKVQGLLKHHDGVCNETKKDVAKLKDECVRRADSADNRVDLLAQTHADFASSSNATVQKTQYDIMTNFASLFATASVAGFIYYYLQ